MNMGSFHDIHSYFANLNPLAERISRDIGKAKLSHNKNEEAWLSLSTTEQENILNNFLIKPEISLKYGNHNHITTTTTTYTYIQDENTAGYRDEHSTPFSFRTKSQMNLSVIVSQSNVDSNTTNSCVPYEANILPKSEIPASPQPNSRKTEPKLVEQKDVSNNSNQKNEPLKRNKQINQNVYDDADAGCYFLSDEKTNLLAHFGSNPTSNSSSTDLYDDENDAKDLNQEENTKLLSADVEIPKGFDFLSNW